MGSSAHYEGVEEVVQVELDPLMIELSRTHPLLTQLNDPAHRDPRHRLIADDAFHWFRSNHDELERSLVDMPYSKDHNLSNVYSREFYIEVRKHLTDDGDLGIDAPSGDCHYGAYWPMYSATLRAAGFETVQQYGSFLAASARRPRTIIDSADRVVVQGDDGTERVLVGADAKEWWRDRGSEHGRTPDQLDLPAHDPDAGASIATRLAGKTDVPAGAAAIVAGLRLDEWGAGELLDLR